MTYHCQSTPDAPVLQRSFREAGDIAGAREALRRFIATRPDLTLREVADALRFLEPKTLERYLDGLRVAGLAE